MVRIIFVGEDKPGSRARQRLGALRDLGHDVDFVCSHPAGETYETPPTLAKRIRHRLRRPADPAGVNGALLARASRGARPDIVWIDYALMIRPETCRALKTAWPCARLIWYSEDDMAQAHNSSVFLEKAANCFDLWVTTKSFHARPEEMPARGIRQVMFVHNSFDPGIHRRIDLDPDKRRDYAADVSFVGTFEPARAASLLHLAESGISVRVWGNGWSSMAGRHRLLSIENRPVYDEELATVYNASSINLGFLRKLNRDLQTCRTIEIPASGGFMLHERNPEVCAIFDEDRQAAFFGSDAELVEKCRRWLADPEGRERVAAAGHDRVRSGGFSHGDRMTEILSAAERLACAS